MLQCSMLQAAVRGTKGRRNAGTKLDNEVRKSHECKVYPSRSHKEPRTKRCSAE